MRSLEWLKLIRDRGIVEAEDCSTVYWLLKVADKSTEEFYQAVREEMPFTINEILYLVTKLADVAPPDIIAMLIRKVCADPDGARVLAPFALRWISGDVRKKIFFEEFIKTFADNPHLELSSIIYSSGALS